MATATRPKGQQSQPTETPKSPETDAPKDDAPKTDAPETPETIDPTTLPPMLARIYALVTKAEESKDKAHPVSDLRSRVDAVGALVKALPAGDSWVLVENLGGADSDAYKATTKALDALGALSDLLSPLTETVDRSEGDRLVNAWENIKASHVEGMFTPEDLPKGDALVTRWRASVPETKSTGAGGSRRVKAEGETPTFSPLGFRVSYKCQQCGKTFSTRTDNLNSARNECIKHSKNAHGALIGNGTTDFDQLGKALVLVGMSPTGSLSADGKGSVSSAEGGGWKTERSDA